MTTREILIDQLNNLNVQIATLNERMGALEENEQEKTAAYEALDRVESALCAARMEIQKGMRHLDSHN